MRKFCKVFKEMITINLRSCNRRLRFVKRAFFFLYSLSSSSNSSTLDNKRSASSGVSVASNFLFKLFLVLGCVRLRDTLSTSSFLIYWFSAEDVPTPRTFSTISGACSSRRLLASEITGKFSYDDPNWHNSTWKKIITSGGQYPSSERFPPVSGRFSMGSELDHTDDIGITEHLGVEHLLAFDNRPVLGVDPIH